MKETENLEIGTEKDTLQNLRSKNFISVAKKTFLLSKHFMSVTKKTFLWNKSFISVTKKSVE